MDNATEEILQLVESFKLFLKKLITNLEEFTQFLKDLSVFIKKLVEHFEVMIQKKNLTKSQCFVVIVYLKQFCSVYELFKLPFHEDIVYEIRRSIFKQLTPLLDNISVVLSWKEDNTPESFLTLMDNVLDKIGKINEQEDDLGRELTVVYSQIEDILCLCMCVGHVAVGDDNKIITAGCRSVLRAFEDMKIELKKDNRNFDMCNLNVDLCVDTLCAFEAKVNIAVLRLCLETFCNFEKPLRNLSRYCESDDFKTEDLNAVVAAYDLHMDRIFQIALFSVASSSIGNCVVNIKNIIANLEFLECELVPAIIASKESSDNLKFASFLKKCWTNQVQMLRKAVHGIVEPCAYCKLVYEELKQLSENLWRQLRSEEMLKKVEVDAIIWYANELGEMFNDCLSSFPAEDFKELYEHLSTLNIVINELASARRCLNHPLSQNRIFKRCQIVVNTVKQIWLSSTTHSTGVDKTCLNSETYLQSQTIDDGFENATIQTILMKSKLMIKGRSFISATINNITSTHRVKEGYRTSIRERTYRQNATLQDNLYSKNL